MAAGRAAETVGQYGLGQVFYCPDPRCKTDIVGPAAAVISGLIQQYNPRLVLLPSTPLGNDWAGRVAGRPALDSGRAAGVAAADLPPTEAAHA